MKKLNAILLVLALSLGSLVSAATEPVETVNSPTSIAIGELLKNPEFVVDGSATAYVTFIVNDKQEMVVLSVDTENGEVERFIKSRLNYKKLQTNIDQGKTYKIPIRIISES